MVISNTTPLFAFAALDRFDLLEKIYGRIIVVETVVRECETGGSIIVPDLRAMPWLQIVPAPSMADKRFYMLDAGERDTLSVALEKGASRVLIDERLGRNLAEYHGLSVVGSLGTLLKARKVGLIPEFLPLVRQLQRDGFRYHEPLVMRLAELVGE